MERAHKEMKTHVHLVRLEQPEDGIDLYELLFRLRNNWKKLLAGMMLGILLAAGYLFWFDEPQYEAIASVYVFAPERAEISAADMQLANFLAADYCEAFGASEVLEEAAQKLGLLYSRQQMQAMIRVSNPADTRMLYIRAVGADPDETAALANAVFEAGSMYIEERMHLPRPMLVHEAAAAKEALASGRGKALLAGAAAGLAVPGVWICLQYAMEERRRTAVSDPKISA